MQFLFVYVPSGKVTGIMYKDEVPTGTDNTPNYSVNNQGRGDTNNSPNNQGRADTNEHNDTTNTSTDNMDRDSNILSETHRAFIQTSLQTGDFRRLESRVNNNRSLMAAYLEQLNQPNLPQQEITKLQQHYLRLTRLDATFTEQRNNRLRELAESTRQLRLFYLYELGL